MEQERQVCKPEKVYSPFVFSAFDKTLSKFSGPLLSMIQFVTLVMDVLVLAAIPFEHTWNKNGK